MRISEERREEWIMSIPGIVVIVLCIVALVRIAIWGLPA
jgi:hypothetical protein